MISNKVYSLGSIFLCAVLILSVGFKSILAVNSSPTEPVKTFAAGDDSKTESRAETLPSSSAFESAAADNVKLKTGLTWPFGGKAQRGWQIYLPLICSLIGTDKEADSSDFALALAHWQKTSGLASNGVLNQDTWSRMVSVLQSHRIKGQAYPSPEQLVEVPTSDLYDPSRPAELRKVERQTYAAYKRMIAAAAADPSLKLAASSDGQLASSEKYLKIISAFRSREYQEQLRKQSPGSGRAGLALNSPHSTGRALDLYVGGEPVSTRDDNRAIQVQTRVYRWLVKNAGRFGFQPYFYEPWHWEYCPDRR